MTPPSIVATYSKGVAAVWLREIKRSARDRGQLIGGISRPVLWVLILGIGLSPYFDGDVYANVRFVVPYTFLEFIFPAVIVLNVTFTSIQSASSLIADRQFGFMREVLVSPMPRALVLLGKVLGGATVATLHGGLVVLLARLVNVSLSWGDIALALVFIFALAFALTSLGVIIANRIRTFEGFGVFSNAVILPLYFTSSSVFPLDTALSGTQTDVSYPAWLVSIVEWNPLTYAVDALRGILIEFNQFEAYLGPLMVGLMSVGFFVLALVGFATDHSSVGRAFHRSRTSNGLGLVAIVALLAAVSFLPPDTSWADVRRAGVLRACVPAEYPPLVADDDSVPGYDIELLQGIADEMGLRLALQRNPAIGRDFNPRSWGVTRASCDVVAGGMVASPTTRSFMETAIPHGETGWAVLADRPFESLHGARIAVLASVSGLDRIPLSSYLADMDATPVIVRTIDDLLEALEAGEVDAGITESMLSAFLAAEHDWWVGELPDFLPRYPLVFGLWKGELTLKRELVSAYERLEQSGRADAVRQRYFGMPSIDEIGASPDPEVSR